MDVSEFLAARLGEDEAIAKACAIGTGFQGTGLTWVHEDPDHQAGRIYDNNGAVVVYDEGAPTVQEADHIARHDPARVLREVEAGRLLLADYRKALATVAAYDSHDSEWDGTPEEWFETGFRLRQVADVLFRQVKIRIAVYCDHPGYDPAWSETDQVRSVQHS